MQAKHKHL